MAQGTIETIEATAALQPPVSRLRWMPTVAWTRNGASALAHQGSFPSPAFTAIPVVFLCRDTGLDRTPGEVITHLTGLRHAHAQTQSDDLLWRYRMPRVQRHDCRTQGFGQVGLSIGIAVGMPQIYFARHFGSATAQR